MARQQGPYQDWDRSQWAGIAAEELPPRTEERRWNKFQWVGDQGRTIAVGWARPQDMPEGESGLSGFRHNPGIQHWAGQGTA
jgi:hypothetical protein